MAEIFHPPDVQIGNRRWNFFEKNIKSGRRTVQIERLNWVIERDNLAALNSARNPNNFNAFPTFLVITAISFPTNHCSIPSVAFYIVLLLYTDAGAEASEEAGAEFDRNYDV